MNLVNCDFSFELAEYKPYDNSIMRPGLEYLNRLDKLAEAYFKNPRQSPDPDQRQAEAEAEELYRGSPQIDFFSSSATYEPPTQEEVETHFEMVYSPFRGGDQMTAPITLSSLSTSPVNQFDPLPNIHFGKLSLLTPVEENPDGSAQQEKPLRPLSTPLSECD